MSHENPKGTDKPLDDADDPKQGIRKPNAAEIEPANRRLDQHPHQTAEVPYGSGNRPEPSGKGGMEAQNPSSDDAKQK